MTVDLSKATPKPWHVEIEEERGEFGTVLSRFTAGIQSASGNWIVRFDDDYGTNQAADAALIVQAVNAYNDLVETLEDVAFFLTSMIADAHEGLNAYGSSATIAREQIRAVLAKAKGE